MSVGVESTTITKHNQMVCGAAVRTSHIFASCPMTTQVRVTQNDGIRDKGTACAKKKEEKRAMHW